MLLPSPRVAPLDLADCDTETRELLERSQLHGGVLNVFTTLAHHPKLLNALAGVRRARVVEIDAAAREREMAILRIGWLCQAEYEWGQHVVIGREAGLTDEEIERIKAGPEASGWTALDSALLRAVDELHEHALISDATWKKLTERYDTQQMIDLIFAVGQYNLVSMALNSLGVQLDEGIPGFNATGNG